jgi:hypothetical protein
LYVPAAEKLPPWIPQAPTRELTPRWQDHSTHTERSLSHLGGAGFIWKLHYHPRAFSDLHASMVKVIESEDSPLVDD